MVSKNSCSMKKGGNSSSRTKTVDVGELEIVEPTKLEIAEPTKEQTGGRRSRCSRTHKHSKKRSHNKRKSVKHNKRKSVKQRGGSGGILETAALPFGLFGLKKFYETSNSVKRGINHVSSTVKRGLHKVRNML